MPPGHPVVLLVDDSADTLEMYAVGLAVEGYRPLTAADHESALDQLKTERPDAIVTDLRFDGRDSGWELIHKIKRHPARREMPVVILTGRAEPSIAVKAQQVGCTAVLVKPCLPEELATVLRRVLPTVATDEP